MYTGHLCAFVCLAETLLSPGFPTFFGLAGLAIVLRDYFLSPDAFTLRLIGFP